MTRYRPSADVADPGRRAGINAEAPRAQSYAEKTRVGIRNFAERGCARSVSRRTLETLRLVSDTTAPHSDQDITRRRRLPDLSPISLCESRCSPSSAGRRIPTRSRFNCQTTRNQSQGIPAVAGDDGADYLTPAFHRHRAARFFQLIARNGVKAIALAKRRPVQAVGFVQNYFAVMRRAIGPLGGTIQHFHKIHSRRTRGVGNNHHRMGLPAQVSFVNFPGVHVRVPFRAAALKALKALRPTASACLSLRP